MNEVKETIVPNFQNKLKSQDFLIAVGAVASHPTDYRPSDFSPGRLESVAANRFDILGGTKLTAFTPSGELLESRCCVEGQVTISDGSLHNKLTSRPTTGASDGPPRESS